jgi:hypothetical protein
MQKHHEQLSDPWNQGPQKDLVHIWALMTWHQETCMRTQKFHQSGCLDY